jgi:DNA polymerase elongation subunit (family B)
MKEIKFNIIDWRQYDIENDDSEENENNGKGDNKEYIIELYGRTDLNDPDFPDKTIYLKIKNYHPHFYLRLPDNFNQYKLDNLVEHIKDQLYPKKYEESLIDYELVNRHRFYGFTDNKIYKFALFIFKNTDAMRKFTYIFNNQINVPSIGNYKYEAHETNILPMLRFMHRQNIKSCGWVIVNKYEKSNIETYTDLSIEANWKDVNNFDTTTYASFKILSFDIECTSVDGSFPQPDRKTDEIITICSTISRYGQQEPYEIWAFSLKECLQFDDPRVKLYNCKSEKELLLKWAESIRRIDPDIITGYNISGFDENYLEQRAKLFGISERFSMLGRKKESCKFEEQKLSSSALGDNILKYYDMTGRVMIDMLKVVQRDHKLSSYKLDSVAENFIKGNVKSIVRENEYTILTITKMNLIKEGNYIKFQVNEEKYPGKFIIEKIIDNKIYIKEEVNFNQDSEIIWGLVKDDLPPSQLFKLYHQGHIEGIFKITKYCIMDCALINMLISMLQILNNNMAMASVCSVPLSFIFLRGQGIKIFSLVSKKCKESNYIIPVIRPDKVLNDDNEEDTYEGAICFNPDIGFYPVPITVLDYGSLYPSSMIDQNMSHETIILDKKYLGLKNYKYNEIWYKSKSTLEKPDIMVTFAEPNTKQKGIVPQILQYLLKARDDTRGIQKKVTDSSQWAILEGLQLAYKVTANSLYGQIGAKTSPVRLKEIAASTTARGREMLEYGKTYVEKQFRKILMEYMEKVDNELHNYCNQIILRHSDILKPNRYLIEYWKQIYDNDKYELFKQQLEGKTILNGDLLKEYENIKTTFMTTILQTYLKQSNFDIEPKIIYGDSVLGYTPLLIRNKDKYMIIRIDRLVNEWKSYIGFKYDDLKLTEKQQYDKLEYEILCNNNKWAKIKRVIRHKTYKKIYRVITKTSFVDVTEDHSLINENGELVKPSELKIGNRLYYINENINNFKVNHNNIIYDKLKLYKRYRFGIEDYLYGMMTYYWMAKNDNLNVGIEIKEEMFLGKKRYDYYLKIYDNPIINPNEIINIYLLHDKYDDYVYDIETDASVFHAGVGDLIIKNTDSNFINWNMFNKDTKEPIKGQHLVGLGIELGKLVEKYIKPTLPLPHKWNYEKTFYPFCILAKKRYIGMKFEGDDDHNYMSYMGIVLKRRDNANIVKKVVSGLLNIMMMQVDNKDYTIIITYMRDQIDKILNGGYPLEDFVLSKTLKATYADRSRMAHVVLADRVADRDPGNAFNLNDRVPFIYIEKKILKGVKLLQGDMVETPDYIKEKKLKVDYLFYITNQIMNPVVQLLEVIMPNPQALFDEYIRKETDRKKGVQGLEKWGIKIESNRDKNKKILTTRPSMGKSRLPKIESKKLLQLKN